MKSQNRELVDRLAAEYALGTLRGRARRHFERWLVSPQVGVMVKAWEDRLAGLEPPLGQRTPPPEVWNAIERRLELRRAQRAPLLRWAAIAASVLFFVLVGVYALRGPGGFTGLPVTQQASIGTDPQTIYWRVVVRGDRQELEIEVRSAHPLEAGKALELWALPEGGNPVSLGLLPNTGEAHRVLNAAQRAALAGAQKLAVSLEPAGGSPTGLPTGPVLHVAGLQPA